MDKRFDKFAGTYNIEWNQYDTSISDKKSIHSCILQNFAFYRFYLILFSFMTRSLNNFTGIQSLNPTNVTATFLITAAIKVVFLKTVQLVTVDVTYKSVIYSLER